MNSRLCDLSGAVIFANDYHNYFKTEDSASADTWKYGIAMTADATTALGGIALMAMQKKTYGLSAIAVGVLGRLGADFIPTRYVLDSIERTDGSQRPIMGSLNFVKDD